MTTGDVRTVFGVVGTTEANGTWTITVIDATHIDLQGTTFANVYTSGGSINGQWDSTNTNNWVTTSGGTNYGQTVPGTSDAVAFDASSGGGTVTPSVDISVQSIACGAFTGTLDWSVNNKNVTLSASAAFNASGTGVRTIKLGNGTWTLTTTASVSTNVWNIQTTTNLTFDAGLSVILFAGVGTSVGNFFFLAGTLTYNAIRVVAQPSGAGLLFSGAPTIAELTMAGPNRLDININLTIATLNLNGTSTGLILVNSNTMNTARTLSVASNAPTMTWCAFRDITGAGGASFVASNSFDLGHNSGITINAPANSNVAAPGLHAIDQGIAA
ncbi:hypothetical protein [Mesorhizobium sp. B1-1-7]|uniref:hypothetical protein n=1 Tax=Mesorhizobium sp. B1-1-7 TaxID=2589977 RepID=UPI00112BCA22|nr:hypothetical protein [Mesorhizobium sp. B1-1-7]TPN44873.1 hypothetical protein FJ978_28245 [Mesorhizobium sp. B1-1-7]